MRVHTQSAISCHLHRRRRLRLLRLRVAAAANIVSMSLCGYLWVSVGLCGYGSGYVGMWVCEWARVGMGVGSGRVGHQEWTGVDVPKNNNAAGFV